MRLSCAGGSGVGWAPRTAACCCLSRCLAAAPAEADLFTPDVVLAGLRFLAVSGTLWTPSSTLSSSTSSSASSSVRSVVSPRRRCRPPIPPRNLRRRLDVSRQGLPSFMRSRCSIDGKLIRFGLRLRSVESAGRDVASPADRSTSCCVNDTPATPPAPVGRPRFP